MMVKKKLGNRKRLAAVLLAVTTAMSTLVPVDWQVQAATKGSVVIENPINADGDLPTDG